MTNRLPSPPRLLVSVRSAAESRAALDGGADLIDVKEPLRGALGAADASVIDEVVATVAGRVPVSAAMGEWRDRSSVGARSVSEGQRQDPAYASASVRPSEIEYVKFGLAGISNNEVLRVATKIREQVGPTPVLVAFADHRRARSPNPLRLVEIAVELRFSVMLFDTFEKGGATLLDWLDLPTLGKIRQHLSKANVDLALAGSLTPAAIRSLRPVAPAWFAVRGAACTGGRNGTICADRVRQLRAIIAECED